MATISDLIIRLQKSKFARRFQYEPYIIKSVEYVAPKRGERLFVIYREIDYFKSLAIQMMDKDDYFSWDVEKEFPELGDIRFDKIVFFVSSYYTTKEMVEKVISFKKDSGFVYCICFLGGSKFFEITLKITDKVAHSKLGKELYLFKDLTVVDTKDFKSAHIKAITLK